MKFPPKALIRAYENTGRRFYFWPNGVNPDKPTTTNTPDVIYSFASKPSVAGATGGQPVIWSIRALSSALFSHLSPKNSINCPLACSEPCNNPLLSSKQPPPTPLKREAPPPQLERNLNPYTTSPPSPPPCPPGETPCPSSRPPQSPSKSPSKSPKETNPLNPYTTSPPSPPPCPPSAKPCPKNE